MRRLWVLPVIGLAACGRSPEVTFGEIPGTAEVAFESGWEGPARVVTTLEGSEEEVFSPYSASSATSHTLPLRGLATTKTYEVAVEVDVNGTVRRSSPVTITMPPPPEGVPVFDREVLVANAELMCDPDGYVLFSFISSDDSGVGVLDREGNYVWGHMNDVEGAQIGRPRPGRDGQSFVWNIADAEREIDQGAIIQMSTDGTSREESRALWGHHDFVEMPDQSGFVFNGYCFDEETTFTNPANEEEEGLAADTLVCVDKGASTVDENTIKWSMCDDWTNGFTAENFNFLPGWMSYSHGNSLAYLPEQDAYLQMYRWIDTVVKLDSEGNLIWVWGGEFNQFKAAQGDAPQSTGTDADLFLQSHFSDAWVDEDGNIQMLVFDNRPRGNNSRIKQFTIDETNMTYSLDWAYESNRYESLLGDVRRIPIEGCDNLIVSLSTQGRILELTRDGEIAWEVGTFQGAATTRVHYLPDLYDMTDYAYP